MPRLLQSAQSATIDSQGFFWVTDVPSLIRAIRGFLAPDVPVSLRSPHYACQILDSACPVCRCPASDASATSTRVRRSQSCSAGGCESHRHGQPQMRDLIGNRLCRHGRPAASERQRRRLASRRTARELFPNDELGNPDHERGIRSQAGTQSCVVEVRGGLDGWNAGATEPPSDIHGQRELMAGISMERATLPRPHGPRMRRSGSSTCGSTLTGFSKRQ